jgi:hypothetical protein
MLVYTREKILGHLQETPALIDRYQRRDPAFPAAVLAWLAAIEETLGQLRLPLASLVAAERGRILAVGDGYRDPALLDERLTPRMATRAVASLALSRVQQALSARLAEIDAQFAAWREKMSQFLAIATTKVPIPLPPTEPRDAWLASVWKGLNVNGEVQGMYRYLGAAMQPADRLFLLDEVLGNLLAAL